MPTHKQRKDILYFGPYCFFKILTERFMYLFILGGGYVFFIHHFFAQFLHARGSFRAQYPRRLCGNWLQSQQKLF